ncbi:procathepsin L-like [Zerene cesonia]|uniref:procathepsin L-like n=1 Tax=Zerene cesonia TaxID=33412 RepID=UPI0018E51A2E|nr:procathepsin L-like [Zerene cesonia]
MFLLLCILSTLASEVFTSDYSLLDQDYYDLNNAKAIFNQFIQKYEKEYDDRIDYHFEVFKQNLQNINKWNKEKGTKMFGINAFTDLTFEEFSRFYLGFNAKNISSDGIVYKPSGIEAPDSLDWRDSGYVSPVKNQENCGSCFAFSATGNVEGQYAKNHNTQAISLSVQQSLDCESQGNCIDGGFPHNVFQALAEQGGSMREEDYPYEGVKGQCRTQRDKIVAKVTGGSQLGVSGEDDLKEALASHGPLSISVCVDNQFKAYNGGVFKPSTPCYQSNHAVLLVGYGNEGSTKYWLIKNSWGKQWGDQGYFRLVMGQRACGIGVIYTACAKVA